MTGFNDLAELLQKKWYTITKLNMKIVEHSLKTLILC